MTLPAHLRVVSGDNGQYASTRCRLCGARAYIGRYEDPTKATTLLRAWIERHTHKEPA